MRRKRGRLLRRVGSMALFALFKWEREESFLARDAILQINSQSIHRSILTRSKPNCKCAIIAIIGIDVVAKSSTKSREEDTTTTTTIEIKMERIQSRMHFSYLPVCREITRMLYKPMNTLTSIDTHHCASLNDRLRAVIKKTSLPSSVSATSVNGNTKRRRT